MSERDWNGDSSFFLVFEPYDGDGGNIGIDVDTSGWIEANRDTFRRPGTWFLMHKVSGMPVLAMPILEGDQFFYYRHHVGDLLGPGSEVIAQVIGRKRPDGTTARLWFMPNGMVMTGEEHDVDPVAARLIGG